MERTVEEHQHNAELQTINDEIEKPEIDMGRVGEMISDYITGGTPEECAPRAIWVTVSMVKQVKRLVVSEIPPERLKERTFKVQLMGQQYDERTGSPMDDPMGDRVQAQMNFALHVSEHYCNDEYELFYNHLLELSVHIDQYMHLITGLIFIYNRMASVNSTGKGRIKSVVIDEDGIETINDRGNTDLGGFFG